MTDWLETRKYITTRNVLPFFKMGAYGRAGILVCFSCSPYDYEKKFPEPGKPVEWKELDLKEENSQGLINGESK